jgi:hypothetical protein
MTTLQIKDWPGRYFYIRDAKGVKKIIYITKQQNEICLAGNIIDIKTGLINELPLTNLDHLHITFQGEVPKEQLKKIEEEMIHNLTEKIKEFYSLLLHF